MDNIKEFRPKEKTRHEKISDLLGSPNYMLFHFTEAGALAWLSGEGVSDEQLAYVNKVMDIITTETIKNNSEIGDY
jgi:hypothetical protein